MSDFDDLDDLFGPLRSPATPVELIGEDDVVDRMVAAHNASKGTTMFTSRRARVATLIAAGILGFGGVAAASPAGIDVFDLDDPVKTEVEEPPAEEPPVEEPPVEEPPAEEPPAEEPPADDGASVDEPDDPAKAEDSEQEDDPEGPDDPESDADVVADVEPAPADPAEPEEYCIVGENHGKTVSAAARGLEPFDEEPFDDIDVRDVARSSCGKTDSDSGGETDETDEIEEIEVEEVDTEADTETDEVEEADERAEQRTSPGRPDHAAGKSNNNDDNKGKGNGKDNGKDNGKGNGKKGS
jgi:hypothetical protein